MVVDRRHVAPLLLGRDHLEGAAEPQLALRIGRALDVVSHRLMQVDGVAQAETRIDRHRRPFDAAVGARQHARAFRRRQDPHVLLRDHCIGEADQAAVLAVVHVDMPGLAGMHHARNGLAALVLDVDQHGRADRVEIPHIMRDVLEVAGVLAGFEVH